MIPNTLSSNPWASEDARQSLADPETDEISSERPPGRKRQRHQEEAVNMPHNKRVREELEHTGFSDATEAFGGFTSASELQYVEVHRVSCIVHKGHTTAMYTDRPRLFKGDNKITALRGRHQISEDIFSDEFAMGNPFVSFAVVKEYDCGHYYDKQIPRNEFRTVDMPRNIAKKLTAFKSHLSFLEYDGPEAVPSTERIYPIAQELKEIIADLETSYPHSLGLNGHDLGPIGQVSGLAAPRFGVAGDNRNSPLTAPYLGIYHVRSLLTDKTLQHLHVEEDQRRHAKHLVDYVLDTFAYEYKEADEQFAQGLVTKRHFPKLFALEEVIVQMTNQGPRGLVVSKIVLSQEHTMRMECWSLDFDGQFYKKKIAVQVSWPSKEEQLAISSLEFFPLKYADEALMSRVSKRGEQFWQCRSRRLIECDSLTTNFEFQTTSNRYMIDIETYKQMHPESIRVHEESDIVHVDDGEPPEGNFVYVLPSTIRGYGFHDKKWSSISVESIRNVTWNSDTFDRRLVLEPHKKELIKALITVHSSPSDRPQKSDIIEGKGKGLIILLHGGPGTGKTLTAESIAEYAHCPLYRVTCGDIGTDPESVEKYLETVLYIGTVWRCVVLLDEADVFLEERTPTDLQRNALVSVFLRTLEYFEGILVLTSNRVGTFDEAFKSRVQLAIHYPPLDSQGRYMIWHMFFRDMLGSDERTKQDELEDQLKNLSLKAMNGRQIRNVINTARQLAKYRTEALAYSHIHRALNVAREFEQYVTATRGHTDEEFAKAERIR